MSGQDQNGQQTDQGLQAETQQQQPGIGGFGLNIGDKVMDSFSGGSLNPTSTAGGKGQGEQDQQQQNGLGGGGLGGGGTGNVWQPGFGGATPTEDTQLAQDASNNLAPSGAAPAPLGAPQTEGGNPFFSAMVERSIRPMRREFTETVLPGIASGYAGGGRLPGAPTGIGGGAFQTTQDRASDTYLRNVGDISAGLGFNTYGLERQNMMRAMEMAPGLAREDYQDIGRLRDVGQSREELSSANLAEQMARWAFGQAEPGQRLEDYMRLITGSFGGTTTTQLPGGAGGNPLMQLLGGAALGTGIARSK